MNRRLTLTLLLAAAVCPYFLDLGGSSIWDANEAFYVETPREMIERGDYVSPTFNYEPRFNKPVLSYWIVAAFYRVFGVSVGVQRLPIALAAVVLMATAWWLARAAYGRGAAPARTGVDAGLWAALGLAVAPRLLMFARRIFIDLYISMFMGLTLLFFALSERYPSRRRLYLILMYVAVGLGALTKGPVAVVLPGLAFAVYLLVHREPGRVREMMIPLGLMVVLAIVVPWYAVLYQRYGWTYITGFFIGENLERFTSGIGVEPDRGPLFYLPVLVSDSFPWSLFLLPAAASWIADRRRAAADPDVRVRTLLWIWIAVIVGFFSLSAAKQDLYIFPIVPAVAALGAVALAHALETGRARLTCAMAAVAGGLVAAAGLMLLYVSWGRGATYALEGIAAAGITALAGGIVTLVPALRMRLAAAVVALLATFVAVNWLFVLRVLPSFEAYKPVPAFASLLEGRLKPDDVVATYDEALPSLVYYLRRHVETYFDEGRLFAALNAGRTVYVVMSEDNYAQVRSAAGTPTCIVGRHETFDVRLRTVLAGERLPELLLITNRCEDRSR